MLDLKETLDRMAKTIGVRWYGQLDMLLEEMIIMY